MKTHFARDGVNFREIGWHAPLGFAPIDEIQQFFMNAAIH
jgi:hypothetical protein